MAGDMGPGDLKVFDVERVDRVERAALIALASGVITRPILGANRADPRPWDLSAQ